MAGDNQMDPADLEAIAGPVARGEVDYAKANRLFTGRAWELMPHTRYLGNAVLSLLTKIASGYWHVADSQSGYTAIGRSTLEILDLDRIYPPLRLSERHARAPERDQRPGARRPVATRVRRGRDIGHPPAPCDPGYLLAADEGVLLADAREVRHPRLPPARLLLRLRAPRSRCWASCSG